MRLALHMQFTQLGDVVVSKDIRTRVDRKFFPIEVITLQDALAHVALALVILLTLIELCELYNDGLIGYITSVWNMLDIACYVLFCIVYQQYFVMRVAELGNNCNDSYVCEQIGNADNWEEMNTASNLRRTVAYLYAAQIMKAAHFVNLAHPPMALAARVLRTALVDLLLSLAFILFVTYGFSGFFYMRLGPYISEYATDELSFIAMIRSIFGDFDLEGVMMMSSSFENVIFLMLYLIVIVFVLMSIFLTILGEYQSQVREEQAKEREAGEERVSLIVKAGRAALRAAERVGLGNWTVRITQGQEAAEEYKEESMRPKGAHAVSPPAERSAEGATILSVQAEVRECAARIEEMREESAARIDECANALRLLLEAAGVEDGVHLKLGASNGATPRGAPDGSRRRRRHRSSRETGPEASSSFV